MVEKSDRKKKKPWISAVQELEEEPTTKIQQRKKKSA
jgi:hypothetical protein